MLCFSANFFSSIMVWFAEISNKNGPVFTYETEVPQVIQPNSWIRWGHQNLVLSWHWFYSGHFPAPSVLASRGPNINSCMILKLVRAIENTTTIISSYNGKLSTRAKVGSRNKFCRAVHFRPKSHLLIRDVPQPYLTVQRTGNEEFVIPDQ